MLIQGDCLEEMRKLEENSVDSIVTDPPYGLSFMGKKWDYDVPSIEVWKECLRVLKPGGYLLSFAGSRTYHGMCVRIEDAGFEIRDMIMWLYGSGFPKSLNIGKQIDKMEGNERTFVSEGKSGKTAIWQEAGGMGNFVVDKGNTEWEGWGTALKPAHEPIVVARKPLSEKNVALNVLKWGTAGINIDECRVGSVKRFNTPAKSIYSEDKKEIINDYQGVEVKGRFHANIILDEEAGKILDEQTGNLKGRGSNNIKSQELTNNIYGKYDHRVIPVGENKGGGASRFFYCPKASKSERNLGCEEMEDKKTDDGPTIISDRPHQRGKTDRKNNHPTVKPIKLMRYLVKLVTRQGATVLDPFMGSGSTGLACQLEGMNFIGIEREEEYIKIAEARINGRRNTKRTNY